MNYDADNWMALAEQLDEAPDEIHVLNRAQLISDSFELARAGQLQYAVPLRLSKYLKNENSIAPWYSAKSCFSYLLARMPRAAEDGRASLKVNGVSGVARVHCCVRSVHRASGVAM